VKIRQEATTVSVMLSGLKDLDLFDITVTTRWDYP